MVYLMIIIVAAVAGITRLALQHRREQKIHLLDDFRSGLERLSTQPLPSQHRATTALPKRGLAGRVLASRRPESPRGQWDRIAPHPTPAFAGEGSSSETTADAFFGGYGAPRSEVSGHAAFEPETSPADEILEEERPRPRPRKHREPLLAGRLWRKPREPWFWTYEKKPSRPRAARPARETEYVDFLAAEGGHVAEGNAGHPQRGLRYRSPHAGPAFAHSRPAGRTGLDPAKREAAKLRIEARRRTGARLS